MKNIAMLAVLLAVSFVMKAQDYKPLEKVDVPDFPSNEVIFKETMNIKGIVAYTASHCLTTRSISTEITIGKGSFNDLSFVINEAVNIPNESTALLMVGGKSYKNLVYHVSNNKTPYIELSAEQIKHISISGLQSTEFYYNNKAIYKRDFNKIEQELWRKTAQQIYKALDVWSIVE